MAKDIIKSEQDLAAKFNSQGWAKRLKFYLLAILDFLGRLVFNIDGASYTDMKDIHIGMPKWLVGMKYWQAFLYAKFAITHEASHILYTPDEEYRTWLKNVIKYFKKTYNFNEGLLHEVFNAMLNGMEDGRIEACFLAEHSQQTFMDIFRFGRSQWYLHNDFGKGPRANSHEPFDELFDGLFCLTTLATMGTLPMGWAQKWKGHGDLYNLMMDSRKYVNAFVAERNFVDGEKALWATVKHIEDWMVELLKKIPISDAKNAAQQVVQSQGGNASKNNTGGQGGQGQSQSGQQQGQGNQSGQSGNNGQNGQGNDPMNNVAINSQDPNAQNQNGNQSGQQQGQGNNGPQQPNAAQQGQNGNANQSPSAMHTAFQNGVDGDGGSGGRIARQEDTYDGDYGTDMNKIVADALRAAEDSLVEEAEATLVQADWEDLCQRQKEEEENNGYDAKAAQAVADYYKTINPNKRGGHQWNVPFQRCRYDLPKVQAPTSIKLEAKKLNQEFSKILLSKASFDSFNRRRGLLDTNGLHKLVGLKQDDIFMKKGNPRTADYVFYVLMDGSGSMSGTKFNEALRACALIEESLKGIAQVKIVVFDFYYDKVRHHVVKEFKEIPYNNSWAYANSRNASGCNMDGFSIRVAKNELLKRPEQNKILITLSDGQPNGPSAYSGTRGENDVSEAVLETRKKGIHVFNIFFGESKSERDRYLPSFKHMYRDKGIISCAPSAIGTELLRIVRREIC